jgi:hypothetical protein
MLSIMDADEHLRAAAEIARSKKEQQYRVYQKICLNTFVALKPSESHEIFRFSQS